ncbi:MAG: sarcosine oxidase subunit gamma family protein [Geminicoccaceae bacterium]
MASPRRTSALAGLLEGDRPKDEMAGITLRADEESIKFSLRGSMSVAEKMAARIDIEPAVTMLTFTGDENRRMARLGPDEWLVTSSAPVDPDNALDGEHHAAVDISERLLAIRLSGPAAREVLAGGCPMDMHEGKVHPGFASRTVMGKADIVLECLDADSFILHTNRSFLEYLWLLLVELGREHGVRAA